jgi:acetyl-CoA acetyltransferase
MTGMAIIGAAETTRIGALPDMAQIQLIADAALNALADAGLTVRDIDGVAVATELPSLVCDYLGIEARWLDGTDVGGCSNMLHIRHAAAAIQAGLCRTVLVVHGESGPLRHRSRPGRHAVHRPAPAVRTALRHHRPGHRIDDADRPLHGQIRPHPGTARLGRGGPARMGAGEPARLGAQALDGRSDVLASRVIAWPVHLPECCVVTDGGGALILTAAERARDMKQRPIHVLGAGEAFGPVMVSQMPDYTEADVFRRSGEMAFAAAGIDRAEVDHLMLYDAFAHLPIFALEALGFVKPGEAGAFFAGRHSAPGGCLPVNTNGGGLSYTHTGRYGMYAIQESVRQLRGTAPAQVPGVEISLAHGIGGMFAAAGTVILSNAAR